MKPLCRFILFILIAVFALAACKQSFKPNQKQYEIKVGETFEINIYQNPSTGYENCWLNQKKATAVSVYSQEFFRQGAKDCNGCGGTLVYTFKGIAPGTDTIKMATCPTLRENKPCTAYSDDIVKPDSSFIIIVK